MCQQHLKHSARSTYSPSSKIDISNIYTQCITHIEVLTYSTLPEFHSTSAHEKQCDIRYILWRSSVLFGLLCWRLLNSNMSVCAVNSICLKGLGKMRKVCSSHPIPNLIWPRFIRQCLTCSLLLNVRYIFKLNFWYLNLCPTMGRAYISVTLTYIKSLLLHK